jgi:hypothetical protein
MKIDINTTGRLRLKINRHFSKINAVIEHDHKATTVVR